MSGHTPGPWTLDRDTWSIRDERTYRVARCSFAKDGASMKLSNEEREANARLIAAAPELLDRLRRMATALSTAASYIARDTDRGIADAFEAEANQARALIAQVEG